MKLIIDIDEDVYNEIRSIVRKPESLYPLDVSIRNGTPINTDGDLISRSALKSKLQEHKDFWINAYGGFRNLPLNEKSRVDELNNCIAEVVNAPTVSPEKVKEGELVKAYTKGFDTGVETVKTERAKGEWIDHSATFWECPDCGHLLEKCCPNCQKEVVLPNRADMRGDNNDKSSN